MNFLDRNTLPKFQERLDLAASELNDMEDIYCEAINELAGRLHIINNLITDPEKRSEYADEVNYAIIEKFESIQTQLNNLETKVDDIKNKYDTAIASIDDKYIELEARLNALDDVAARKKDLNAILYRTGQNK